jgi:hypothetical protein
MKPPPIRISAFSASQELGVTFNKVTRGLKFHGIVAGKDGKYSLKDIVTALSTRSRLELKAKDAKYQCIIDDAEAFSVESKARRAKLAPAYMLEEYATALLEKMLALIRASPMTATEKKQLIEQIGETKFELVDLPAAKKGKKV